MSRLHTALAGFFFRLAVAAVLLSPVLPAAHAESLASKLATAKAQFERAEKQRIALEFKSPKERILGEYTRLVAAYRRVYLITPRAAEVSTALLAVAQLYQEMGRQFDAKYYQSAVDAYQFLLHEYPTSRYREDALLTVGQILKNDMARPDLAEKTFEEFLSRHSRSRKADQARKALAEIAAARGHENEPASQQQTTAQRDEQGKVPQVTQIRTWNGENSTRIVIDVEEQVKYQSARISNPDRIYFDLHKAKLSPELVRKNLELQGGFLKNVRVAQNQVGVVRVVLEVEKVKDYSVFLLPNPNRLVVELHGAPSLSAKSAAPPPPEPEKRVKPSPLPVKSSEKAEAARPEKPAAKLEAAEERSPEPARTDTVKPKPEQANQTTRSNGKTSARETAASLVPPTVPEPTRSGQHSLTRALGLKIGRIVIDPGHGGHDTGTIGPTGLMEKDLCLDIALRLGKIIQQRLPGAEVIHTREDDTFVPLERRTEIANQSKADLFLSIHANSSSDHKVRGVETYYLNFSASEEAMEVASRENAFAQGAIHELQDLVKKIARNEKIEESRELAAEIQEALSKRFQRANRNLNRGVRKAPFVVLIGAHMPSVLSEIAFLSNPGEEQMLKKPEQRQRIAEGLYRGVENYLQSINSLSSNRTSKAPTGTRSVSLARAGNSQ